MLSRSQATVSAFFALALVASASGQRVSPTPHSTDRTWHVDSDAKYALRLFLYPAIVGDGMADPYRGAGTPADWLVFELSRTLFIKVEVLQLPPGATMQSLAQDGGWVGSSNADSLVVSGIDLDLDGAPGYEKKIPFYWEEVIPAQGEYDYGWINYHVDGNAQTPLLTPREAPYKIRARWRTPEGRTILAESEVYIGYSTGISIADGATFTNSLQTELRIVAPNEAVWARVSNDGGFLESRLIPISKAFQPEDWQMATDYVDRSTRLVYVRFLNSEGDVIDTVSDSIIYDPEPPEIVEATLTDDSSNRARKPTPSRNLTLRVKAEDTVSGIDKIEIRRWNKPDKTQQKKLTARISLPANEGGVSFRVSDRAGNWTAWKDLKREGADAQRPTLVVTAPKGLKVATTAPRYVLKGSAKDNIAPRSIRFRVKGPKDKKFGEPQWLVLDVRNKEKSKGWKRSIKLNSKGQWKIEVQAYDAEGNATPVQTVTVTRR